MADMTTDGPDLRAPSDLLAHRSYVRVLLRHYGVRGPAVDDLTQDVWLLAVAQAQSFPGERAAKAWLKEVCRRLAANHRRVRAGDVVPDDQREIDQPIYEDPLDFLESMDLARLNDAALARLKDEQRDVLSLYASGDLSMREVAAVVGEREATVYARYRAALEQLSRDLKKDELSIRSAAASEPGRPRPVLNVRGGALDADRGKLVLYRCDSEMVLGRVGNVVIARWQKRAYEESSESVGTILSHEHARLGIPLILINDASPELPMPNASERRVMLAQMGAARGCTSTIVDIFSDSGTLRLKTAILIGFMSVTRSLPSLSFRVVLDIEHAQQWVEPHARSQQGPVPWSHVRDSIYAMRSMT